MTDEPDKVDQILNLLATYGVAMTPKEGRADARFLGEKQTEWEVAISADQRGGAEEDTRTLYVLALCITALGVAPSGPELSPESRAQLWAELETLVGGDEHVPLIRRLLRWIREG